MRCAGCREKALSPYFFPPLASSFALASATALAGVIHDAAGDYGIAMYMGGVLALFAGAIAFNIGARPGRGGPLPAASY